MKYILAALASSVMVFSNCQSPTESKAKEIASEVQAALKEFAPGAIPTSENGYSMKAKIDGRDWTASHMIPDESASNSKRIQAEDDEMSIGFYISLPGLEPGKKRSFSENHAVDLWPKSNGSGFWAGKDGEVEVTKIDEQWLEGKFHFSASSSSSNKVYQVTDGFFRIPLKKIN